MNSFRKLKDKFHKVRYHIFSIGFVPIIVVLFISLAYENYQNNRYFEINKNIETLQSVEENIHAFFEDLNGHAIRGDTRPSYIDASGEKVNFYVHKYNDRYKETLKQNPRFPTLSKDELIAATAFLASEAPFYVTKPFTYNELTYLSVLYETISGNKKAYLAYSFQQDILTGLINRNDASDIHSYLLISNGQLLGKRAQTDPLSAADHLAISKIAEHLSQGTAVKNVKSHFEIIQEKFSYLPLDIYLLEKKSNFIMKWLKNSLPSLLILLTLVSIFLTYFIRAHTILLNKSAQNKKTLKTLSKDCEQFKKMIDGSIQGILIHDELVPIFANKSFLTMHGFNTLDEFMELQNLSPLLPEDTQVNFLQVWDNLTPDSTAKSLNRVRMNRIDGGEVWVSVKMQRISWKGKNVFQSTFLDITDQILGEMELEYNRARQENSAAELVQIAEELDIALRKAEDAKLFQKRLMETVPNLIYIEDRHQKIIQCNEGFLEFAKSPSEAIINKKVGDCFNQTLADTLTDHDESVLKSSKPLHYECEFEKDGDIRFYMIYKTAYKNILGDVDGLITVLFDITERKLIEKELNKLATIDPLTGIYNRRRFLELANMEFVRSERYQLDLCTLILDIDHFKSINDSYGHATGDEALIVLSKTIQEGIRESDIFGRFGGEEFVLLLPNITLKDGIKKANFIRKLIEKIRIDTAEGELKFTASFGITKFHHGQKDTISKALQRADEALYVAKEGGRNKVVCYDKEKNVTPVKKKTG